MDPIFWPIYRVSSEREPFVGRSQIHLNFHLPANLTKESAKPIVFKGAWLASLVFL